MNVFQIIWELHQIVDQNVLLAVNVHQIELVINLDVQTLVEEPVALALTVKSLITVHYVVVRLVLLVTHSSNVLKSKNQYMNQMYHLNRANQIHVVHTVNVDLLTTTPLVRVSRDISAFRQIVILNVS